jgi:hypothetical protein
MGHPSNLCHRLTFDITVIGESMNSEDAMNLTKQLAWGSATFVLRVDNTRILENPIMDDVDYDHAEEVYDQIAKIINESGLANHAKAYVVAQLGIFAYDTSGEDIDFPVSEDFG